MNLLQKQVCTQKARGNGRRWNNMMKTQSSRKIDQQYIPRAPPHISRVNPVAKLLLQPIEET